MSNFVNTCLFRPLGKHDEERYERAQKRKKLQKDQEESTVKGTSKFSRKLNILIHFKYTNTFIYNNTFWILALKNTFLAKHITLVFLI